MIDSGQIADPDTVITKVFCESPNEVVPHKMEFRGNNGTKRIAEAESFSNSYTVFAVISQPKALE